MGFNFPCRFTRTASGAKIETLKTLLAVLENGDEAQAEEAIRALAALGEQSLPVMKEWLNSSDADRRWWAVCVLAQNDAADAALFIPALKDEALDVRQAAALGLTYRPHLKAVPDLLDALCDSDRLLSSLAVNALVEVGGAAVPALLTLFEAADTPPLARVGAMRALAKIADSRAIPAMMSALADRSALVRHWAEAGLEKLGLDMVYMIPK